jgi:thermolabile hemolysin
MTTKELTVSRRPQHPYATLSQIPFGWAALVGCLLFLVACPVARAFDALYAFGDSLTDTGNNPAPAGNYYNGRYSNGPLWVEYMSTNLGFAYVQSNNYANSGSQSADTLLAVQSLAPPADAATAAFAIWSGANDFIDNVSIFSQQNDPLWAGVISNAIYNLTNAVAILYADGARTIIVPNLPDLSKLPAANPLTTSYRTYMRGKVGLYNTNLLQALNIIRSARPDLQLSSPDLFTNFNNILASPAAYGFTKTTVGALEDSTLADKSFNGPGSDYVFWDTIHPTTKSHALIANWISSTLPSKLPIPLSIQNSPGGIVLSWSDASFSLQSATNVTGPFGPVANATSPYTNNIHSSQLFFRLKGP